MWLRANKRSPNIEKTERVVLPRQNQDSSLLKFHMSR